MIPTRSFRYLAALAATMLILAGCGGGGGAASAAPAAPPAAQADTGALAVTLTDAEGDFVAYIVDVVSMSLRRTDGTRVEALPLATRVDFTQLTDVSEFLAVATVPAGVYEEVVLTLDYTGAEVIVQGDDGEPLPARVVDAAGAPIGRLDVTLELTGDSAIRITPTTVRAVSLDFDLDASNTIDRTSSPPTVTVDPILLAAPELERDREHRVRGLLAAVDEARGAITLRVRPFRHRGGDFGRLTFGVTDTTRYAIDGIDYTGAAGLGIMADLRTDTPVVALGTIEAGELVAQQVMAGSSVYWSDANVATGLVTARDADTLTLRGVTVGFTDGRYRFVRELTVQIGPDTAVAASWPAVAEPDHLSISVGQQLAVVGEFVDDRTLDARAGRARMLVNRLWADVVEVDPLVVDVHLFNGRRPSILDFTGTGISTADDARPDAYRIDTGALDLAALAVADRVQIRGLVNRFGFAPPDFLAGSIVDVADAARGAIADVAWPGGSTTPFVTVAPARIDLDLADARARLALRGPGGTLEPERLALTAPASAGGVYVVARRGAARVTTFRSFDAAAAAMVRLLDAGGRLHRVTAHGRYTAADGELETVRAAFVFETANRPGGTGS